MREQSEAACLAPIEEPCPPAYEDSRSTYMDKRPPAPLPKYYDAGQTRSNTSNRCSNLTDFLGQLIESLPVTLVVTDYTL